MQIALACKTLPTMPHKWCAWMSKSNESFKKNRKEKKTQHTDNEQRTVFGEISTYLLKWVPPLFSNALCFPFLHPSFRCMCCVLKPSCMHMSLKLKYAYMACMYGGREGGMAARASYSATVLKKQDRSADIQPIPSAKLWYTRSWLWQLHKKRARFKWGSSCKRPFSE